MSKVVKLCKVFIILALIVGIGLLAWLGSSSIAAGAALTHFNYSEVGPSTDLANDARLVKIQSDDILAGGYNSLTKDIDRALYLYKVASLNWKFVPYHGYYTDAGGSSMFGSMGGALDSRSFHAENKLEKFEFHQWINGARKLTEDVSNTQFLMIRGILNRATQSIAYDGNWYGKAGVAESIAFEEGTEDAKFKQLTAKWKASEHQGSYKLPEHFEKTKAQNLKDAEFVKNSMFSPSYVDFTAANIIKPDTIKIVEKTSPDGKNYYAIDFTVDVDVANKHKESVARLESANAPGKNLSFVSYSFKFEIWKDSGLFKMYEATEKWIGTLIAFTAQTESKSPYYFTYSLDDLKQTNYVRYFNAKS